jgi:hypothetical protein
MKISVLKQSLAAAGFVKQTTDDEGFPALEFLTKNAEGIYVGDVLEIKGFKKSIELERGKTWVTFRNETLTISHRPNSTNFCAIANKYLAD